MDTICPVCNGLRILTSMCTNCGQGALQDEGTLQDQVGPYAPYETAEIRDSSPNAACNHLVVCNSCGARSYIVVKNDIL